MSKNLRGQFKWWVGGIVSASLMGACGMPEQDTQEPAGQEEQATSDVQVSLSVGKSSLAAHEDAAVTVTFTNVGTRAARLLEWDLPGEGVREGRFEVMLNGEDVAYVGPHIKYAKPTEADYVTLAPGQSLTRTMELSGHYNLEKSGSYTLRYDLGAHGGEKGALASNDVTVWIEGRASRVPQMEAMDVQAQALSTTGCTSTQTSSITTAFSSAKTYSSGALSYLTNHTSPSTSARYKTWFGTYSSTNWSTAKSHFSAINSAFNNQAVVVSCACTSSAYAYVYPAQPYKIYVCNAFWNAPNTGTDSKAGTLVHEMSHFNVVAATDDHAYGQSAAKNLAISSPTRALDNADNHEYFAENTPAQN
jgi:peptidyl-Lys metalloendopeptidase